MSKTKLTARENLAKYAFWFDPVGHTEKENQVKMYKNTVLGILPLGNGKDPDQYQTVGSGSV
jgi:hypothetical protein